MNRGFSLLKKFLFVAGVLLTQLAHGQDANDLYNTANNFMRSGDYANAILVFNQALQLDPENTQFKKQLAFAYYLRGDISRAKTLIDLLLDKKDADAQTYQIAGNIYQSKQEWKGAQKIYDRGIRKFSDNGALYNDNGQLLATMKMFDGALYNWLKGIEMDPNFPGNYYNAARAYNLSKEPVWAILYGEIFINLESYTTRTAEMREIVLESYKKLFNDPAIFNSQVPELESKKGKKNKSTGGFDKAYRQSMAKQISVVNVGIEPESLLMLRTRFILDWYNFNDIKFPYSLFDFQRKLLKEGLYEAYNQWLFGPVNNQAAFKAWTGLHKKEYDEFLQYQRNNPLKLRPDEYYNDGKVSLGR